ncbi:uncharacterized protein [Palaemon carinicauda]|uniref:uncharacterized protein isoform X3 n=1 Tax=Palaemon carinicauda TaxID=392227 RepID=UPI0035B609D4
MRAFIRDHRTMAVTDWPAAIMVGGDRRHPLLAQLPSATQHPTSSTARSHIVGVPSVGVPGVGVKLMQEPGFAANDSHLYARDLQMGMRYRGDSSRNPESFLGYGIKYPPPLGSALTQGKAQLGPEEELRRHRTLSPGSQSSAAASFLARASQLTAPSSSSSPSRQEERERRRRRRRDSGERDRESSGRRSKNANERGEDRRGTLPTDYRAALAKFAPPVPHTLLKKIGCRDVQGLGKVRVVLRVSPKITVTEGESEVLTLDKRRRQVTLVEPQAKQPQERVGVAAPKMFAFDQVYNQEDPQNEVVTGAVVDVLHAVLAGNDGCVLCFGGADLGKTYTMLGSHTGPGELGVMPSSIAWLYRAIVEQKAKSGARFSVRVSAVAVDAAGAMLTDLLAEYAQEGEASPGALLRDTTGGYLSSVAELRAPSPETAAHYLDVAIAARSSHAHSQVQSSQPAPPPGSATLLYTLHIYQYAVDKSGKGGVVGGRSRLHMIDVGDVSGSNGGMSLSALTSVLLAIFNGQRYLPHRENKLTMLLREALGSVTCHAAMVVHISPSPRHAQHTLATLQLASRVHRMRRKKLKGIGGSNSGGSSEGSRSRSSGGDTSAGSSSIDFSSSEQSCDTVIYIGGGGPGDATDNEHPPVFMPHHTNQQMWPITRLRSMEHLRPHSASPTPAHTRRAASASPTPTSRSVPNGRSHGKPRPPPRTVSNANSPLSSGKVTPGGSFIRHQPGVSHVAYNKVGQKPLLSSFKPQVTLGPLVPGDLRHFNYNAYEEPNNLVPTYRQTGNHPQQTILLHQQQQPLQPQQQQEQHKQQQHQHQQQQQQQQQQQPQQQQQQQQLQQLSQKHIQQQLKQQHLYLLQHPQTKQQQIQQQQQIQHFQLYQQQKQLQSQQQSLQQPGQQQSMQQQYQHQTFQQQHLQLQQQQLKLQQLQQQQLAQQSNRLNAKNPTDGVVSDEQWIDGPRVHKSRVAAAQKMKKEKSETWVDGPQVTPIGYGFMDDHKKTMIERWVAVQTAQVVQQLEQQQTVPPQTPTQNSTTQEQFTHLTQFRTCEESTLDSDQDTLSEDPPSGAGQANGTSTTMPPQPNLIEELERKNLIPAEDPKPPEEPDPPSNEAESLPKECTVDEKSTEPHCSPDEASVADEPSIDDICSQCEALAEECEELSSLLSCEEEECKRQAHQGLATVLEEPELEAAIGTDIEELGKDDGDETGHEADEEESTTPQRGWIRRSLASSGTHHSTELIEVQIPDYPVITVDTCIQVCEEDIIRALADTPCQSEVMSVETSDDHPLRVLSEENLTCASTFTDSYSQMGETGDEDDSDDENSRPFSLFEVTDYGRVCQDLSMALQSDVSNKNLHELAKIHDLYRTLARQSPRVHTGGPRLQAATLAEILANSRDSLLEDQKPPLEDDSICSEPVHAEGKLCRHCNKKQLRHGDSILKLESALRSKSMWLSRPLELEDSASDKCIGTDDIDLPEDHCTCDVQSDLVPYIPSMFFNFSSMKNNSSASNLTLTQQASNSSLQLKDVPLADSTENFVDRVPINGISLPEYIEDLEANVVLCNPVQYDYSKDSDVNDDRTVTGKSDNESDCVSNISEDSEYMMQTSKLSKFLCVGVGKSKSKSPYKVAKQNNNKIVENKKNVAKTKESKVKVPVKSRENSKSPDRNSKNLIKSPSRVVSQSVAKQNTSRRSDNASVRMRWGKSARVGATKSPALASRSSYRYTCTLMYPPDAPTPTEGYDSGHDSGAATQGSATPLENPEAWRTTQNLQPHKHHPHPHQHPAANSGSLGTNPSLGESSGYESIPRDSECSSFSSSQDSEMDEEHRRDAQAQSLALSQHQLKPPVPSCSAKLEVENWSEDDVKRYEGRPRAAEIPQLRASRQQVLSLKATQKSLKADLAQAKGNLNVPSDSWNYERKSNYT